MNVVAYCRYSSEMQRDGYSIEAQTRAIEEYCKKSNYELIHIYVDEARTATSDDREQFQQMIKDSAKKTFQAVIVHKFDRFARNKYDSAIYKKTLKDNGARVISVLEPLDDSPESGITEALLEAIAEYYSKNLGREAAKGKREVALRGLWNGGRVPYGYKIENKKYIFNESEAIVVRKIFDMISTGKNYSDILRDFISNSIKTRNGNNFNHTTLRELVENPIYKGTYTYKPKSDTKPIIIDNAFPGIISSDQFTSVQTIIKSRKIKRRFKGTNYFLTGYLYCGLCGSRLIGHSKIVKTKKGEYRVSYYRCGKRKNTRYIENGYQHCELIVRKKGWLENYIIDVIKNTFLNDNWLDDLAQRINKKYLEKKGDMKQLHNIETELYKLYAKQKKLLDVYLEGTIDKNTYNVKNHEINRMLDELKNTKNQVDITMKGRLIQDWKSAILALHEESCTSESYKIRLISTFVDKVIVYNDKINIIFKLGFEKLEVCNVSAALVKRRSAVQFCFVAPLKTDALIKNYQSFYKLKILLVAEYKSTIIKLEEHKGGYASTKISK